ncbi:MAG: hypothetical protein KDI01_10075, partial [Halioglobus sp.]|nr:hypothetical protein [Halioglobus sp.]
CVMTEPTGRWAERPAPTGCPGRAPEPSAHTDPGLQGARDGDCALKKLWFRRNLNAPVVAFAAGCGQLDEPVVAHKVVF